MGVMTRYPVVGEKYKHEGSRRTYRIVCLARDDDRDEILVIHEGPDGTNWSRTLGNFMGMNESGFARFTLEQ